MFGNTNFNTSSMVALSTTRADEVLVDVHNSAYGPTDNQPTDNRSNAARSVRFQNPLINNRVVSSSPKPGSNNNPFFQIDNSANISKADDELMELLARISNYAKSRNQGHSGYNGQAAYNQDNRGYEAPTQPSSDLSLVRQDAHTEYSTGRVSYTPSSFRLFNDIVKQIPKFDGTPDMLKLFCTAVEEAVEQLPFFEQRIVRALQSKLVGDARYIVGKLTGYQCAQELLRDLRDRFVNRNVADGLAMQLGSAKEKAGEDVRKFGITIRSLYDNAIAAYEQAPDLNAYCLNTLELIPAYISDTDPRTSKSTTCLNKRDLCSNQSTYIRSPRFPRRSICAHRYTRKQVQLRRECVASCECLVHPVAANIECACWRFSRRTKPSPYLATTPLIRPVPFTPAANRRGPWRAADYVTPATRWSTRAVLDLACKALSEYLAVFLSYVQTLALQRSPRIPPYECVCVWALAQSVCRA
ncbi:unnamed protein product [Trichogramma brassicae]|uniref:Uncharacterized protein n=1 Tax=Trichogramma brassicae TaxID=86971 RepID=A0A6H5IJ04_9HYME|nr:unnamed protein product [Trichogramma brassicae]